MQQAYAHCTVLVREADKDRYLANLFLPDPVRDHAFALHAFNVEVGAIRERTREPLAGEIRLQWWRDLLAGKAGSDAAGNPVAAALADTIERCQLPRELFVELVDARRFDVHEESMPTMAALEAYLRATSSSMFALVALSLEGPFAATVSEAAGLAYGLTGLLRSFAAHASHGKIYLPVDVLEQTGAQPAQILLGEDTAALRAALAAMRGWAASRLQNAESQLSTTGAAARGAYLPLSLVRGYLDLMERPDYEPFRTPVELPQWRRQWTLWRAARASPYR
jgi:phytoene synthase